MAKNYKKKYVEPLQAVPEGLPLNIFELILHLTPPHRVREVVGSNPDKVKQMFSG